MAKSEMKSRLLAGEQHENFVRPVVQFSTASKKLKGEDTILCKQKQWVCDENGTGNFWNVFMICDGHCGAQAADFVTTKLWNVLKPLLPTSEPPRAQCTEGSLWCKSVQQAIVRTFAKLNDEFICENTLSGCTVTLVLQCDWTLTVANVGDSDALLDTITGVDNASLSHRLDENPNERHRLRRSGRELGRLTSDLSACSGSEIHGLGPIRCWPGGLANSRSIGDHHGGQEVIATPHIKQFLLPAQGGRVILASDGLWDSIQPKAAINISRRTKLSTAADRLMTSAVYQNGWAFHDDISIIVVEVSPGDKDEFYYAAKKKMKSASLKKKLVKAIKRKFWSKPKEKKEAILGEIEILDDVDGLNVDLTSRVKSLIVEESNLDQLDSASEMEGLIFSCAQEETAEHDNEEQWEDCVSQFIS